MLFRFTNAAGIFTFPSLLAFAQARPQQYARRTGEGAVDFHLLQFAGYAQDDIRLRKNLSLTFGLRWESQNYVPDHRNPAPRVGFAYKVRAKSVLRGGYGIFYAFAPNDGVQQTNGYLHRFENQITFDGRPNFTTITPNFVGWFNGPKPDFQTSQIGRAHV